MATFGRNRQSIADISQHLQDIFSQHPRSHINDAGDPVIPADNLVDVFNAFSDLYDGLKLMSDEETEMLQQLINANPGLEVTPAILLGFIAEKTKHSPPRSPSAAAHEDNNDYPGRGRSDDRDDDYYRSSSSDSNGTTALRSSGSRRQSIGPPQTPTSAKSPFDAERRQRTNPIQNNAPSSWNKRPAPAHRRKSDAGSRSDSESFSASPSAFGRTPGRSRAPSNPTSPSSTSADLNAFSPVLPVMSPTFGRPPSRPHSRAQSQPQARLFGSGGGRFGDDDNDHTIDANPLYDYRGARTDDIMKGISSLPMPRSADSDSDGEEDSILGLVLDRSAASSTVSLEPMDRLDVLQRANAELSRKLMEAEKMLQNKLMEHESELEDMQGRLEEMRSELNAAKREEKELRAKERQNIIQIGQLEHEITKVTAKLDASKNQYQNLQKSFIEQRNHAEAFRKEILQREDELRTLREEKALYLAGAAEWEQGREAAEARIAALEAELSVAQHAHEQLDEQKHENLLLKETIDRMRFDMDEMRNNMAAATARGGSGQSSAQNSVSKSLGAELLGRMKGGWGMEDEETEGEKEVGNVSVEVDDGEETEGEDVIQTIITRKKRKVASRANKVEIHTTTFEETKEYSDSSSQYDPLIFSTSHHTQTDPEPKVIWVSLSTQTEKPRLATFASQTELESTPIPRIMAEIDVQTDEFEEVSRSPSPHAEQTESMASSSSTIVPPTPKAQPRALEPHDEPPAYNQINAQEQEAREWRALAETLKKWHPGAKIPFEPVDGGISPEAIEEWKALKEELGVECMVIDKIVESSERAPRSPRDGKRRGGRFYNIYNTYVYGDKSPSSSGSLTGSAAGQLVMWIGASALVLLAVSPYMVPHYSVQGGPTYYDRTAWSSFNTMQAAGEGFSPDGTAAVWNFLGRVGGGAARIARGWPT
ncbi:hypothetical protein LshimejAT787_0805880 [Lyophyllum shimeji]|uniref:Uncharacterized protein n=1 Tax=Lyophyllum shimeji TaxID=47721 RepID=A0A9P3PQC8_LYOSH|nr:hypothetical protein LshimejAT787_0805880 [Lyophyllum shimeji]